MRYKKAIHSRRITYECSEFAREQRIALYKSDQQQLLLMETVKAFDLLAAQALYIQKWHLLLSGSHFPLVLTNTTAVFHNCQITIKRLKHFQGMGVGNLSAWPEIVPIPVKWTSVLSFPTWIFDLVQQHVTTGCALYAACCCLKVKGSTLFYTQITSTRVSLHQTLKSQFSVCVCVHACV